MLSKRTYGSSSFYDTICPQCGYRTKFAASNIVQREYRQVCSEKVDYNVIDYDIKCQMCLNLFQPTRHKTANLLDNPMKEYLLSPMQKSYISKMKSYLAVVPQGLGGVNLGQRANLLRHNPCFDDVSIFVIDELQAVNDNVGVYVTGHNLTPELMGCHLGLEGAVEVPVSVAMAHHFHAKPRALGDVSHVTRI